MRGLPTRCDYCGIDGEYLGIPAWGETIRCYDRDACMQRVLEQKNAQIKKLEDQLNETKGI